MLTNQGAPSDTVLNLTGLIYAAVADPSRWRAFLKEFIGEIGARHGVFAIGDSDRDELNTVCRHGWPDVKVKLYLDRFAAIDPWRNGAARWPEGSVGTDAEMCPRKQMEASVVFREFYAPHDAIHGIAGLILANGTGRAAITATRGAREGPFGNDEKSTLRKLMPHLKRAVLLHKELGSLRQRLTMFTGHMDRYFPPLLLTDAEAHVLFANSAALEVIRLDDGLRLENGCLAIATPRQNLIFRQAVNDLGTNPKSLLRPLVISRPSQKQAYRMILMPIERAGDAGLSRSVPGVSILIVDSGARSEPDVPVLCELFSLTPSEARIAGKLALGRSVEEIAAEAGISVATVRTHVKRILAKTSTQRQGELISLILQSLPIRRS